MELLGFKWNQQVPVSDQTLFTRTNKSVSQTPVARGYFSDRQISLGQISPCPESPTWKAFGRGNHEIILIKIDSCPERYILTVKDLNHTGKYKDELRTTWNTTKESLPLLMFWWTAFQTFLLCAEFDMYSKQSKLTNKVCWEKPFILFIYQHAVDLFPPQ